MTSSNLILPTDTFIFDLFYGEPGSGKSDAIKHMLIQALKENPGKKVKLVVGDGSVATYNSLVASGKAEMCLFMQRPWPMDVLEKLTSGWWLKDPKDPTSPLIKPNADTLNSFCATAWEGLSVMGKYILGSVQGGLANQAAKGVQMGPDPLVRVMMGETNEAGKLIDGPGSFFGTNGTAHYMAAQTTLCALRRFPDIIGGQGTKLLWMISPILAT
jgi:hypothetical protein